VTVYIVGSMLWSVVWFTLGLICGVALQRLLQAWKAHHRDYS
jgi:membrane protein DedA with SNARE-associated domain